MKKLANIILIFLISYFIIAKPISKLELCNLDTAKLAIPPRIHFEQTIDGPTQRTLITRLLHNKVGIFMSEFGRCYFAVLDFNFIFSATGVIGLVFWLYFVYATIDRKKWYLAFLLLVLPIIPFLNLYQFLPPYIHKVFAIMGATLFFNKKL